jgi:type IV pilus assembly protein PilO
MPDLRKTRKSLQTALAVMVGVDLLLVVLYFSPVVGSAESRRTELNDLQAELTTKTREVAPLKDLPHKVDVAGKQIDEFYKTRFPSSSSQVLSELGKLTSANGVKIEQGRFKMADDSVEGLQAVAMEYDLAGSYTSLARFINAVERDEMFFVIDSITLGGDPQGPVKLAVRMETFLKVGAQ